MDEEKIPLSQRLFKELVNVNEHCIRSDVDIVFRIHNSISLLAISHFVSPVRQEPPPLSETRNSFHSFWDDNLCKILLLLLLDEGALAIRNDSSHSATATTGPDLALIKNNRCIFRGEERVMYEPSDPKQALSDKLFWVYSPAPYVLGQHLLLHFANLILF
jgi:hypothetical protein